MKKYVPANTIKPCPSLAAGNSNIPNPLGYSMAGAAQMLSVSCRTVARLTKEGHLHPSKALRKKIYRHSDLVRFLEETSR